MGDRSLGSWLGVAALVAGAVIPGCTGLIGDGSDAVVADAPRSDDGGLTPASTCETASEAAPLRRLSRVQYVNVLTDVVKAWVPSVAEEVLHASSVLTGLNRFPDDARLTSTADTHGGFRRLDQSVQQDHVDAIYSVALAVAAELTSTTERVGALVGACAVDAQVPATRNDAKCVRDFIKRAGPYAHRRGLEPADIDSYVTLYGAPGIDAAALADVLVVMLNQPYFFYQVEHGVTAVDEGKHLYALGADELAARLSMHYWETIPDDALRALASSGRILTDDGYAEALAHVRASEAMKPVLSEFFREYLSLEDLPEMDTLNGRPMFDAVRDTFTPGPDTREHMIDEATRLSVYYATAPKGTFADLFTTKKSFATTADVATLYGLKAPWSGAGEPPDMPDAQRVGVLTHAALVASGGTETRPILKGVFVRRTVLCDPLPPPPANALQVAMQEGAMLSPLMSTRARTEALTQKRPDCASCHKTQINPLGFITENFDPLGRTRSVERIVDSAGKLLAQVPIDTTSTPNLGTGDPVTVSNATDFANALIASRKPQACFARKYFRFTFAQIENETGDACLLKDMQARLGPNKSLGAMLVDLANSTAFKQRRFN